jgi:hypothetical protein
MSEQRKYTSLSDWYAVKSVGLDPGRRPVPEQFLKPSGVPQPPVPVHFPVSFSLFEKEASARDRRRQVDQLLTEAGVRPRAR